jgi:hypothetical protein
LLARRRKHLAKLLNAANAVFECLGHVIGQIDVWKIWEELKEWAVILCDFVDCRTQTLCEFGLELLR